MKKLNRKEFQDKLRQARKITVLTGAGVSAESGVPTFRDAGGLWRRYKATDLASPEAWQRDPGLVWEFYNHRRAVAHTCKPNEGHLALARLEARFREAGRTFTLITQNVDGLHEAAGSERVVRLHGSLWQVRCLQCAEVTWNHTVPITPAFEGSGSPDPEFVARRFETTDLPQCHCGGVIRPHIVWFGERLSRADLDAAEEAVDGCDLMLVIGTSAVVYPAAGYVPIARRLGAVVAEVNVEPSAVNNECSAFFKGKAGEVLPSLLGVRLA
ncbi:SIR2 family NAD-dependent protein deacylase [Chondromyces crocatus]|uniref:NAD-dependent protein deacylase n=1 Tax=Chondromyces crocatus TaxID=52 RepID=A0A0K1EBC3_CHOCO|nr:NAD-dependent deacylase [Chondromyces crocatus]AKT38144.1 NAD-dependent deacetylase [Chondromyces crocatus]